MIKKILPLFCFTVLNACSIVNQPSQLNADNNCTETKTLTRISSACDILHYYEVISALTDNQKLQAAKALQSSAAPDEKLTDCNQIKLAILLSAPNSVLQDDKASIDSLTDFINNAESVTLVDKIFASFLKQFVEERSQIRHQHTKTRNLLKTQQQEAEIILNELVKTRQQLQQLKSLESELNHQEKRIVSQPAG